MLNKHKIYADKPNQALQLTTAIAKLKRESNDFKLFTDFLAELQASVDVQTRSAVSPQLQWNQGESQIVAELITLIRDSEKQRNTARSNQEEKGTPKKENAF
jgi:hypothetical protein